MTRQVQKDSISPARKLKPIQINRWPFISGNTCPRSPTFDLPTHILWGVRICTLFRVPVPERRVPKWLTLKKNSHVWQVGVGSDIVIFQSAFKQEVFQHTTPLSEQNQRASIKRQHTRKGRQCSRYSPVVTIHVSALRKPSYLWQARSATVLVTFSTKDNRCCAYGVDVSSFLTHFRVLPSEIQKTHLLVLKT